LCHSDILNKNAFLTTSYFDDDKLKGYAMTKRCFRYGWVPDVPDVRDFLYAAIRPRLRLAPVVDLRKYCSTVENQGRLGSCTANALAGMLEFLDNHIDHVYDAGHKDPDHSHF
jgi:hypothetical protein